MKESTNLFNSRARRPSGRSFFFASNSVWIWRQTSRSVQPSNRLSHGSCSRGFASRTACVSINTTLSHPKVERETGHLEEVPELSLCAIASNVVQTGSSFLTASRMSAFLAWTLKSGPIRMSAPGDIPLDFPCKSSIGAFVTTRREKNRRNPDRAIGGAVGGGSSIVLLQKGSHHEQHVPNPRNFCLKRRF